MSLLLFTSVAGSPGVSTTALGLTLAWPASAMVVDADHQQSVLAGFFRAQEPPGPGLTQVAVAAQRSSDLEDLVWSFARPLPGDAGQSRRRLFMPGPQTPWEHTTVENSWHLVAPQLKSLSSRLGVDVLIDVGRLRAPEQPSPRIISPALMDMASVVVVMVEPTLKHVAAARVLVDGVRVQAEQTGAAEVLLVVRRTPLLHNRSSARPDESFTNAEVQAALQVPVVGEIAHAADEALVLSHGHEPGRRWNKGALATSLTRLAGALAERCDALTNTHTMMGEKA